MRAYDLPPQAPIFPPEAADYERRTLALSLEAEQERDVVRDIAYGADYYQRIDIWRPRQLPVDRLPVLMFAHGGAWTNGYKEWMGLLAPAVTRFPAIYISVSHRLAPQYKFPAPFEDCLAALTWTHGHIADYGGDPRRIFVGGHSSGGHLYALCALRPDALLAAGMPAQVIRACFPVSARFNLVFDNPQPGSLEHRHQSMLFDPGQDAMPASPYHHVAGSDVPFLVTWGSRDLPSIIDNGKRMVSAMERHDCFVRRLVLENYDHFDAALKIREPESPWMAAVRKWMVDGVAPPKDQDFKSAGGTHRG